MTPSTQTNQPHRSRNSHRRARYGETRTAGSGGDHAEKDPPTRAPRRVVDPTSRNSRPRSPPTVAMTLGCTTPAGNSSRPRTSAPSSSNPPTAGNTSPTATRSWTTWSLPRPAPARRNHAGSGNPADLPRAVSRYPQRPATRLRREDKEGDLGPPTGDRQAHLLSTPLPLRRRRAHWSIPHRPLQAEPAGPCGRLGYPTPPDNPGHDGAHPADGRTVRQRCDGHRLLAPQREAVRNCSPLVFRC